MAPLEGGDARPPLLLEVGRVARPHGLLGEVVVALVTNRTERLDQGTELVYRLASAGATSPATGPLAGPDASEGVLKVRESRPFQGRFLVRFEGIGSREAADRIRDAVLFAPALEDPEALFVHDLVGSELVELDGTSRGRVVAVQANPASDLLVTEDGSLVPLRFVVERAGSRLVIDAPAGLFE
jgi:16S rRNA processing protein RimM